MPEFKRLTVGERPASDNKYLLVEELWEPAVGRQYRISGQGCDLASEYTHSTWPGMRERALALAAKWDLPVVYLSAYCGLECDADDHSDRAGEKQ